MATQTGLPRLSLLYRGRSINETFFPLNPRRVQPKPMTLEDRIDDLVKKVEQIHTTVIKLETAFNGGPTNWNCFITHTETIHDQEMRLRKLEKIQYYIIGIALFLSFIFGGMQTYALIKTSSMPIPLVQIVPAPLTTQTNPIIK